MVSLLELYIHIGTRLIENTTGLRLLSLMGMEEVSSIPPARDLQDVLYPSPHALLSSWRTEGAWNQVSPYYLDRHLAATVQPLSDLLSTVDCIHDAYPTAPPDGTLHLHFIFFKSFYNKPRNQTRLRAQVYYR